MALPVPPAPTTRTTFAGTDLEQQFKSRGDESGFFESRFNEINLTPKIAEDGLDFHVFLSASGEGKEDR